MENKPKIENATPETASARVIGGDIPDEFRMFSATNAETETHKFGFRYSHRKYVTYSTWYKTARERDFWADRYATHEGYEGYEVEEIMNPKQTPV